MRKERAYENRKLQMYTAQTLPDNMALDLLGLYPKWNGNGVMYTKGHIVNHEGFLYRCLLDHVSQYDWVPEQSPSLWVMISDPALEWPQWRQPQGAHDAYRVGDRVSHEDKRWISDIDANTYEPGVYGWSQQ